MGRVLKIAFCGLGSIGSRHLRNIKTILDARGDTYTIDWVRSSNKSITDDLSKAIHKAWSYDEIIDNDYDIIFITNPTHMHFDTVNRYQWHTKSLFIEKPLFDSDKIKLDRINPNCIFYIACPVRYKQVIQYIKSEIDSADVLSAIAVCSSYLPEWRKGTDYRKGYSAIRSMGGGVSLDLIHELDYLTFLFGEIREIYNIRDQVSPLDLDSDDVSVYIAKFEQTLAEIYLDYFGRKDIRELTLFCKEDTIKVDLLENIVYFLKSGEKITFEEERDDFQKRELEVFLDIIDGKTDNSNDLDRAYTTLRNSFGRI